MKRIKFYVTALFLPLLAACSVLAGEAPGRIVSVSPNVTEMLYGVGAFGRVVGVSDYCTYPPEVKKLPRVGGWQNTSMERIVGLRPGLVILTDAQKPFLADKLEQLGVKTLIVPSQTLEDVFTAIALIGRATGNETQAKELTQRTRAQLDDVRKRTGRLPRRTVLLVVDRTPGSLRDLYTATEGSFLAELLEIAGGHSIAAPGKTGYAKISKEAVLTLNPEVVIDMVHGNKGKLGENPAAVWSDLPELQAVRGKRVYATRDEFIPHASQFVGATAKLFAELIHPEAFASGGKRVP